MVNRTVYRCLYMDLFLTPVSVEKDGEVGFLVSMLLDKLKIDDQQASDD